METITRERYEQLLAGCAKTDLGLSRRDARLRNGLGSFVVCGSKIGNLDVQYNASTGRYTIIGFNTGKVYVDSVKAAVASKFLVANYSVTLTDTVVKG